MLVEKKKIILNDSVEIFNYEEDENDSKVKTTNFFNIYFFTSGEIRDPRISFI